VKPFKTNVAHRCSMLRTFEQVRQLSDIHSDPARFVRVSKLAAVRRPGSLS
jgi:hypothetical protein